MSEIWTATEEKDGLIIFEVKDKETGEVRTEQRYKDALPLMFILGGYPAQMGATMADKPLPWRFHKRGEHIYIDGPSVGSEHYHPIGAPA